MLHGRRTAHAARPFWLKRGSSSSSRTDFLAGAAFHVATRAPLPIYILREHEMTQSMTLPSTGYVRQAQLLAGGVPFSAATLWRKVKAQTFPAPVKLSAGVTAWRVDDVRAWMENQPIQTWIDKSINEGCGPVIDDALIKKLVSALATQLPPPIPFEIDLWDVATIARLLKRNESQVRNRIVCLPDFPKAIRLPTAAGPRLYRAAEVLAWVSKYQDKD